MTPTTTPRKKSFSSFTYKEALKYLGVEDLMVWSFSAPPIPISDFFRQRLERLKRFDLDGYEVSRTLLIDAICEEGLEDLPRLKIWKGAYLEDESTAGNADYLVAQRRGYLEKPFVCVIEAKRDDFEQGAAQCLVEMKACQWTNQQAGRSIDAYGIVTNGEGWKFYRLTQAGEVFESLLHGIGDMSILLGLVRSFFQDCERNLD